MRKIKNSLRGVLAAVMAVVFALSLAPTTALATVPEGYTALLGTGSVKLSKLDGAENVELYKVASVYVNANGELHYEWDVENAPEGVTLGAKDAAALTQEQANAIASQVTDAMKANAATVENGVATVSGLDAGLYFVKVTGSATTSTRVFQNIVVPVTPKDSDGDGAYTKDDNYTAYDESDKQVVYPIKSQDTSLTKTVKESGSDADYADSVNTLSTGDTASFKVDVTVPFYTKAALNSGKVTFKVVDTLVANYVNKPTSVEVTADGVTLTEGTDYTVGIADGAVTVTFKADGLKKLNSDDPNANAKAVTITYDATVVATGATEGPADINNAVLTFSKSSADPETTGTTSDKVQAQFYSLTVIKKGSDTDGSLLSGAEFTLTGQNLPTNGVKSTDKEGTHTFQVALGLGDVFNLSETKAPAGYLKVADQTVKVDENGNITVTVVDQKDDASILPSTGGAGTIGLTVAGVAIMAGAAVFVVRSRKQDNN